jgi:hypothetical protein
MLLDIGPEPCDQFGMRPAEMSVGKGLDWLRRLSFAVVALLALSVGASSGVTQKPCCPMQVGTAPCHADAMGACNALCSYCQAQVPLVRGTGLSLSLCDASFQPLREATVDQILAQPATPPPRG